MRYFDPESASTRDAPKFNYEPRAPDTRPRRGPVPRTVSGEKWQRGADFARPSFDKSALDRDLERYGTKRQREREGAGESHEGRVSDDWRAGRRRSLSAERTDVRRSPSTERTDVQRIRTISPDYREQTPDGRRETAQEEETSPTMRPESPLRGDRSDGSDMMIEEDD